MPRSWVKENVIAGTACGFGTFARSNPQVDPEIVRAKPQAMAEGARLASAALWGSRPGRRRTALVR
ncbi:hypothetical protein NKDENANG_01930 [Candidatus Entotheonellaceae bacterium PAL068K]